MYTLHSRPNKRAGEGQGAAPLAGSGLGGEPRHAGLLVVEGLGNGRVRLVGPGGGHRLVLVVDAGGRAEGTFQPFGADQRRRAPQAQHVDHLSGDVDPGLRGHLLADERHREERGEIVGADRLAGSRVKVGLQGLGQLRHDVEPLLGHLSRWKVPAHLSFLSWALEAGEGTVTTNRASRPHPGPIRVLCLWAGPRGARPGGEVAASRGKGGFCR